MVACHKCGKQNSLDSRFCRKCGEPIVESSLVEAQEENRKLVEEGYRMLADNRLDEAELIAETALKNDPSCILAIALAGDCHEHNGRISEALECYEQVLEKNPDSTLDRIKVQHLRRRLNADALEVTGPPSRKRAVIAAVAATVLVASIGGAIALTIKRNQQDANIASGTLPLNSGDNLTRGLGANSGASNGNQPETKTTSNPDETENTAAQPGSKTDETKPKQDIDPGRVQPEKSRIPLAKSDNGELPDARPNGEVAALGNGDISPMNPFRNGSRVTPSAGGNSGAGPDPAPERGNGGTSNAGSEATAQKEPPPVIDIRPSQGGAVTRGGSEVVEQGGARVETLIRSARNDYQTGNFARAADALEKALSAGADPGSTNQRLAQSYEKLGRVSDAISAYFRAANAYESAAKSGRGDSGSLTAKSEACRAAIRVLQGK